MGIENLRKRRLQREAEHHAGQREIQNEGVERRDRILGKKAHARGDKAAGDERKKWRGGVEYVQQGIALRRPVRVCVHASELIDLT